MRYILYVSLQTPTPLKRTYDKSIISCSYSGGNFERFLMLRPVILTA